jgi:hypothetical protein
MEPSMSFGTVQAEKMTTESGYSLGAGNASSFKNRIINGGMTIDQRNAGASITPTNQQYSVDRWLCFVSAASKYTVQRDAGSVTPPVGFVDYLGITSSSAYSVGTGEVFGIEQRIEGSNASDLAWGTANAKPVTLSFWVRSSLTGTFGGAIRNAANNRSYPFTYTISSANTWEYETITIPGDTSGTWLTDTGSGPKVTFSIGTGSTYSGTAGAWSGTEFYSATGATSVLGTNGATWYVTGVQLEVGTVATSFDFRSIGTELALCQRYFEKSYNQATVPGTVAGSSFRASIQATNDYASINGIFAVPKRADPTTQSYNPNTGTAGQMVADLTNITAVSITSTQLGLVIFCNNRVTSVNQFLSAHWTASAEL